MDAFVLKDRPLRFIAREFQISVFIEAMTNFKAVTVEGLSFFLFKQRLPPDKQYTVTFTICSFFEAKPLTVRLALTSKHAFQMRCSPQLRWRNEEANACTANHER